jgi:hypothetical protein
MQNDDWKKDLVAPAADNRPQVCAFYFFFFVFFFFFLFFAALAFHECVEVRGTSVVVMVRLIASACSRVCSHLFAWSCFYPVSFFFLFFLLF